MLGRGVKCGIGTVAKECASANAHTEILMRRRATTKRTLFTPFHRFPDSSKNTGISRPISLLVRFRQRTAGAFPSVFWDTRYSLVVRALRILSSYKYYAVCI